MLHRSPAPVVTWGELLEAVTTNFFKGFATGGQIAPD